MIRRTIDKWLKAGVLEQGGVTYSDTGVPQGSEVASMLSNLFLHDVLDTWFEDVVKPRLEGEAVLCRFADDALILCARERDAQRIMAVFPKRFEKYGLTLHPEKTCVIRFTRPPRGGTSSSTAREPHVAGVGGPAWLYPLLGEVPAGQLGGQAQDGFRSSEPCPEADQHVVPGESTCPGWMATSEAGAEAPGPLRLLWRHHEQSVSSPVSLRSHPNMAEMAKPAVSAEWYPMGSVP